MSKPLLFAMLIATKKPTSARFRIKRPPLRSTPVITARPHSNSIHGSTERQPCRKRIGQHVEAADVDQEPAGILQFQHSRIDENSAK